MAIAYETCLNNGGFEDFTYFVYLSCFRNRYTNLQELSSTRPRFVEAPEHLSIEG